MIKRYILPIIIFLIAPGQMLQTGLEDQFQQLDENFSGNLGVYIKHLGDGTTVSFNSDRDWYLASVIKIPLAIAVLQKVEEGELSLDSRVVLFETDFVDGAGDLLQQEPGSIYTVLDLIERSVRQSDSTATDMLIRLIGVENFNEQIRESIVSEGIGPITTILQVRYEVYSEIHENARNLSNRDIIELRRTTPITTRLNELMNRMGVDESEINVNAIPAAYELFYQRGINSGNLESMGLMLERLAAGELLNEEHTALLIGFMSNLATGANRIIAGLPDEAVFAHKTGTLISRACNMGIVYPQYDDDAIIVAACVERYNSLNEAEGVLENVGRLLSVNWLQ